MARTTTAARHATGPARRAGLDRDDVVDAALTLVEAEGPDALTMRRLAAELGVATTTVYWHAGSRDELVTAVISRLSERLAARQVRGGTPAERVADAARNVWRSALEHRHVTSLAHQVGATSLLELPLEVALATELEAAGLRGARLRDAHRALLMCVAGFLVVALRPEAAVPEAYRSQALWAGVDAPGLSRASLSALQRPPALRPLFESTVATLVAGMLGTDEEAP